MVSMQSKLAIETYSLYVRIINHTFYFPADRAKQIKTKAVVNEDPTEALIRELKVIRTIPSLTYVLIVLKILGCSYH